MPSANSPRPGSVVVCLDVGSTFTKALLVNLDDGAVLGHAEHRTTIDTDVLDGVDACLAALAVPPDVEVLACSSAGGGLRIAVVGNEELVTAEAGRRVALSSGGKVVAVLAASAGFGDAAALGEPDVVLLTGGTDGGNAEMLIDAAHWLRTVWSGPVVVAGNAEARDDVVAVLDGVPCVVADNVVPQIGVLAPDSARAAIRDMFVAHVIGGKGLSQREEGAAFVGLVRGATPDVVLSGVEVLAREAGDVVVVDVGGATTDVHSVGTLDPEAELSREVVGESAVNRTVEGDLGMRWSAVSTAEAAGLAPNLLAAARERTADPGFVPTSEAELDVDEQIASAAAGLALRRHAGRARVVVGPEGRVVERSGTDLREVAVVVASGGVFRHGRPGVEQRVLAPSLGAVDGGWQLPERARVVVDSAYVLAAVGLLAPAHPAAASALARTLLGS